MFAPFRAPGAAPNEAARGTSVSICTRCGVVAPSSAASCEVCRSELAVTRGIAPFSGDDMVWVAVRASFVCRGCDFRAPLDFLDADGAVDCASCGLHQRFEVSTWSDALAFAHAVGDLAGPSPEGRAPNELLWIGDDNPHADVGVTTTFASRSTQRFSIDASPGHPVCRRCKIPVSAQADASGVAHAACPRCHDAATYALPAEARALRSSLVAIVADDHRTDQPRAVHRSDGPAVALNCPSCGAPITLRGEERLHTCEFCRASCLIPARAFRKAGEGPIAPEIWWILFRGPSDDRVALETPGPDAKPAAEATHPLERLATKMGGPQLVRPVPVAKGIPWREVAMTVAVGVVALVVGYFIAGP